MTEARSKQAKVTDEHREEARLLKAIWDAAQQQAEAAGKRFTQESFGGEFGIGNQAAVGFFLNGKTALSAKAASGFARGLGCRVADFSPRLANGEALTQRPGDKDLTLFETLRHVNVTIIR